MATVRIPIFGAQTLIDTSGDVFMEPYSIKATNDQWDPLVLVFNDTSTRIGFDSVFEVPQNYSTSPAITYAWTSTVITNEVVWDFEYRAVGGNDTESLDQTGTQESVTATDTAPSAANERMTVSMSLTAGNFSAGDTVTYSFFRDGADAADDLAGAVLLFPSSLMFEYDDGS